MSAARKQANCDRSLGAELLEREWRRAVSDARQYAREHANDIQAEWDALDGRTTSQRVREDLVSMSPERRAQLNAEWDEPEEARQRARELRGE